MKEFDAFIDYSKYINKYKKIIKNYIFISELTILYILFILKKII